jgi:hypothetical protein
MKRLVLVVIALLAAVSLIGSADQDRRRHATQVRRGWADV